MTDHDETDGVDSAKEDGRGGEKVGTGLQNSGKNIRVLFDPYHCGTCLAFRFDYDPDDRRVGFCSSIKRGATKLKRIPVIYPREDPIGIHREPCPDYDPAGKRAGG